MTQAPLFARTFDTLAEANLEQVYQAGKNEVLRDRAFRILLAHANSVAALEALAFESERDLAGWTTQELLEISNRFRLLSSPENEIRVIARIQQVVGEGLNLDELQDLQSPAHVASLARRCRSERRIPVWISIGRQKKHAARRNWSFELSENI